MNSSSSVFGTLIGYVVVWAVSAAITGALAARKNRSALAWAVGGALCPGTAFLVVLFMPYLCPKCQRPVSYDEWKQKECPRCGGIRSGQKDSECKDFLIGQDHKDSESKDFLECPSCQTMIPPGEPKCPKCGWS
jgi:hypothetical protein